VEPLVGVFSDDLTRSDAMLNLVLLSGDVPFEIGLELIFCDARRVLAFGAIFARNCWLFDERFGQVGRL